jgi:hypothetical protein
VHVADAIDTSKPLHTNLVIADLGSGVVLCDVCFPLAQGETGSATEWSTAKVIPNCGGHAKAWSRQQVRASSSKRSRRQRQFAHDPYGDVELSAGYVSNR